MPYSASSGSRLSAPARRQWSRPVLESFALAPEVSQPHLRVIDPTWSDAATSDVLDDPLLGCLIFVLKAFGRPASAHALTAGLPLTQDGLTPGLLIRAAARANVAAKVVR